jgi:hypothetical protein
MKKFKICNHDYNKNKEQGNKEIIFFCHHKDLSSWTPITSFRFFLVPFNASSNTALVAFSIPYLSVEWQDALKISKALHKHMNSKKS